MNVLPGFWHAAARLSGRVDWTAPLREHPAASLPRLSAARLVEAGLSPQRAQALLSEHPLEAPGDWRCLADEGWPAALVGLSFAPAVLFYRGDLTLLGEPALALVGTRRCTETGRRLARTLARAVVEAGAVVVSGLAYGIDAEAHGAVPERTVAVLGQSLDLPLDRHQQRLADQIVGSGGLLLSEFPPGTRPARWTFPQRNRIIAGLARATVVVEAAQRSGALITARFANEFGREVLAVPGSPLQEASQGCLDLLADGARLCRGAEDLLSALALDRGRPRSAAAADGLPGALLELLEVAQSIDDLIDKTDQDPVTLMRRLGALELTGMIQRLPGDRYIRTRP